MTPNTIVIGAKCVMTISVWEETGMAYQSKGYPWCIVVGESREDCQRKFEAQHGSLAETRKNWNAVEYWEEQP